MIKNESKIVILKDANGQEVDKTTYTKIKTGWSWARLAPGWDTDSKNDWYKDNNPSHQSKVQHYQHKK